MQALAKAVLTDSTRHIRMITMPSLHTHSTLHTHILMLRQACLPYTVFGRVCILHAVC
jgi:hypothetical protein